MGSERDPQEVFMPIPQEAALRQFEVEAMRGILDNLKRVNEQQIKQTEVMHSMDKRLVRIEENSVNADVKDLRHRLESLERDRDRREGAINLFEWVFKHWPGVAGFIILVLIIAHERLGP